MAAARALYAPPLSTMRTAESGEAHPRAAGQPERLRGQQRDDGRERRTEPGGVGRTYRRHGRRGADVSRGEVQRACDELGQVLCLVTLRHSVNDGWSSV